MAAIKDYANLCTSVFKSDGNTVTTQEFTDKWIKLIHTLQKDRDDPICKAKIR